MARPPSVSIHIRVRAPGRRACAEDIVRTVAEDIASGRLSKGLRLPPVRELEHQLGISKNTVQAAYDELVARGLAEARARDGVYTASPGIAEKDPFPSLGAAPLAFTPPRLPPPARRVPGQIELSTVFIDPELLPVTQLTDCFRSVLSSPGLVPFYDAQGYPPLRAAIAERLRGRGMEVDADDVVLTTGSQQALDMVGRALSGGCVALEEPVYSYARLLFEDLGKEVVPLPLDPFGGPPLEVWAERIGKARPSLLYAITSYQNPTGYSYSTYEMVQLLEMSKHYGFALLEDDWGSDMLSCGEYRPTLRALGGKHVLYANSFTKKLLPALRVGYIVGSPETRDVLVAEKRLSTLANVAVTEAVVHEFLDRGYYDTHLKRVQAALDERYLGCLGALEELMPEGVRWSTPGGGPTLWLEVPRSIDLPSLRERLFRKGVTIEDSRNHFSGAPHLHGFRVSYAYLAPDRLRQALERLAEALSEEARRSIA
ncbi:PLP-dependent aminotransferase family protein [Polyangium aurulentum]|uniref:aminotransferase-like domain-containing protein n=1 Tax=Polyangium aurulentum TaxID=2567896 RepID=UPI0010AE2EA8|nr:PLP-dependent aminotransferase family protein [Polyangium aurulentum]UQA56089.1 PLP-dependent aminotransferase family protein [Polyangium aurulentum]